MKIIVHCYQYSTLTAKADVTIVFKKYWNRLVRSKESKIVNVMCTFELDTAPTFCHKEFEYKFYLWAQISTPQIKSVHFSLWTTSQTSNASSHSFNKMSPTRWSHFSTRCGTQQNQVNEMFDVENQIIFSYFFSLSIISHDKTYPKIINALVMEISSKRSCLPTGLPINFPFQQKGRSLSS